MIKRFALGLLALVAGLALLGTVSVYAVGGRAEALLLFVKYVLRKDHAPNHEIAWVQGPQQALAKGERKKPNVILIVADDLGFNDITLNGGGIANGSVPTPHINSIAQEGVNFQTSYSGNATCAPSRAAIMTGRYPTRFGFEFTPTPKQFMQVIGNYKPEASLHLPIYHPDREADLIPYEDMGLPTSEVSLAKIMKADGYRTLHVGKWHLGDSPKFRSYSHGFDEALSFMHGSSMYLPENDPNVVNAKQDYDVIDRFQWAAHSWGIRFNDGEVFKPKRYATDYLTDEAVKAISANKNQPFFLYLAYTAPHTPLQATREDYDALPQIKDHTMRVYAAMIRALDRNVGRVLQSLKDQGLDDDTLVIFTSDNGGAHYIGIDGLNSPYRGWKATFFEGGIRVPLFMRWPARLPKGKTLQDPVSHMDIFATAAAAAGAKVPADRPIDGVNLLPFVDKQIGARPHETLFWRTDTYRVVRDHDWKLQVTQNPRKDWLYNLADDPLEKKNLALADPQRVQALTEKIMNFNKSQIKPLWPSLAEGAIPIDKTLKQPQSPQDEFIYYAN